MAISKAVRHLHAFRCGTEFCSEGALDPAASDGSAFRALPYSFYLIAHHQGYVAFDAGPNRGLIERNVAYIGSAASSWKIILSDGDDAAAQLSAVGVDIADVGHVVMSHLHYDHAGGMRMFSNAQFWIQAKEWSFAHDRTGIEKASYIQSEFAVPTRSLNLVDGALDLFGDGSLSLVPTPGHTPGHQSLIIKGARSSCILAGDAAYLSDLDNPRCLPGTALAWDISSMRSSVELLKRLRDKSRASVIATHDADFYKNNGGSRVPIEL